MSRRAGLTKEIVVETAMKIADTEGINNLTLLRLSKELGIRSPSLYEHVEGMDGLMKLLRLSGLKIMAWQFRRSVTGISGDEAIRRFADSFRKFVKEHPSVYSLTVQSDIGDSEEIRKTAKEILDIIYAILRIYGLSDDKIIHATRYMRSVLHGFVSLEISGGFGLEVRIEDSFDLIKEVIISNIMAWR